MGDLGQEHYYSPSQRNSDMSASAIQDPAFEPHSTFMFDEPSNDEQTRNMRRNMASINMMGDGSPHDTFDPMNDLAGAPADGGSHQFQSDFVNPFMFDQTDVATGPTSWQSVSALPGNLHAMSMQADILSGRSASVAHQYGQITPPDDNMAKSFAAMSQPAPTTTTSHASASTAKSERARNAANQRHAKAKKVRKDSLRKADTPHEVEEEEVDDKREKYREKNRLAAAKCRAKKKVNTEDLEASAREATKRNNQLRAEERQLRDMFSSLRDQALAHDPTQGCGCAAIHSYNMHQAQKAVRGAAGAAMGYHGVSMPSPSQRSIDSGSPSTIAPSRTTSFSSMRPQFQAQGGRADSTSSQMSYLPTTTGENDQSQFALTTSGPEQMGQTGMLPVDEEGGYAEYVQ